MKKLILFLSIFFAPFAQAHFFAQQTLFNPKTGQTLDVYYDTHESKDMGIDFMAQQQDFIQRAKKNTDTLVLSEDKCSFEEQLNLNDTSESNKQFIERLLKEVVYTTPLIGLSAHAFLNGSAAATIECRPGTVHDIETLPVDGDMAYEIAHYNDTHILNNFYRSIPSIVQKISQQFGTDVTLFMHNFLMVDAKALHSIANTSHKHIMLAAGSAHIVSICNMLHQLGWIPGNMQLPQSMSNEHKQALEKTLTHYTPDQATCVAHYLSSSIDGDIEEYHALDITRIPHQGVFQDNVLKQCFTLS